MIAQESTTNPWPRIIVLWLAGILAAAQLGKMAALAPLIADNLALSLTQASWLISLLEVSGATLGLAGGLVIARLGTTRALIAGLALLAIAGLMQALATGMGPLFIARLIESGGYLLIVIAAPSLIAVLATPETRGPALVLWSTFVPIGIAAGSILSGSGMLFMSWQQVCLFWMACALIAGLTCLTLPRRTGASQRRKKISLPDATIWMLAAGFGCYTTIEVGVLGLLPSYLTGIWNLTPHVAGLVAGIASASTVIGSLLAAYWLRRAGADATRTRLRIILAGLAIPALLCIALFPPPAIDTLLGPLSISVLAIAINVASGLLPAIVFARLPDLVTAKGGGNAEIATANGLLAQFGAAGSLVGPPLFATIAQTASWPAISPAIVVLSALALALFVRTTQ